MHDNGYPVISHGLLISSLGAGGRETGAVTGRERFGERRQEVRRTPPGRWTRSADCVAGQEPSGDSERGRGFPRRPRYVIGRRSRHVVVPPPLLLGRHLRWAGNTSRSRWERPAIVVRTPGSNGNAVDEGHRALVHRRERRRHGAGTGPAHGPAEDRGRVRVGGRDVGVECGVGGSVGVGSGARNRGVVGSGCVCCRSS